MSERYVALLRGVNVGGHAPVAMADLRAMATGLRFTGVTTLLQSGNLVFAGSARATGALELLLERTARERLDLETELFVRTASEWRRLVAANPFEREAKGDPARLFVMLLKDAPSETAVRRLRASITGPEAVRAADRRLYLSYPAGIGRSRLTGALIERTLGTRGTARNWNTVRKLAALVA